MHDITKLPKWAQDELVWARRRITELEAELNDREYIPRWEGGESYRGILRP